jgi:hypothetical protein
MLVIELLDRQVHLPWCLVAAFLRGNVLELLRGLVEHFFDFRDELGYDCVDECGVITCGLLVLASINSLLEESH